MEEIHAAAVSFHLFQTTVSSITTRCRSTASVVPPRGSLRQTGTDDEPHDDRLAHLGLDDTLLDEDTDLEALPYDDLYDTSSALENVDEASQACPSQLEPGRKEKVRYCAQ